METAAAAAILVWAVVSAAVVVFDSLGDVLQMCYVS
jgi:hypothetical protein